MYPLSAGVCIILILPVKHFQTSHFNFCIIFYSMCIMVEGLVECSVYLFWSLT